MKCARCNGRDAETTTTGLQMFYCRECSLEIDRMNRQRLASSGDSTTGGSTLGPSQAKERAAMKYLTSEQVKQYVATWLRYVSNQPMSQPRFFKRVRATLTLPAPQPKGDNHG